MERTAEGRSELAELADESASSANASIPLSPRGARSMTGSTEALLYVSNVERRWAWVRECKTSHGTTQDADNATVHWALEPIRRPKAGTGPRSARPKAGTACTGARECRPKAGTDLHWGTECRPKAGTGARSARPKAGTACTGARECRPKAGTGLHWGRPKAGTGLHWGHVGVPCCRPKAGAGWAEGPALRRAQCARGAVSSALCTARGSAVCVYIIIYTAIIYIRIYCGIYI